MRPRHYRRHITAAALCAVGALSLLNAIQAGAASATSRPIKAVPLQLPPDAATGNNSASNLFAMNCLSPGSCTVGGGYANRHSPFAPMVASKVRGRWQRAIELVLPPNEGGERLSDVESVGCAAAGDCTAVGSYSASDERAFGFVAGESRGRWGAARETVPPRNALHGYASGSELTGVACTGPATCLAVGDYVDAAGRSEPMAVSESHGRWSRAVELNLPGNASRASDQSASLVVACHRTGFCTAVGQYFERSGTYAAWAISESGGKWQRPIEIAEPPGASLFDDSDLDAVSCTGPGSCTAVGSYTDRSGDSPAMVASQSGGHWTRARAMNVLPANADATQPYNLNSVSCVQTGDCVAVGTYRNKIGGTNILVVLETAGKWVVRGQIRLPTNADSDFRANDAAFDVGCTSSGNCAFGGDYNTKASIQRAIVAVFPLH